MIQSVSPAFISGLIISFHRVVTGLASSWLKAFLPLAINA
jgi:hypothetical protein